MINLTSGNNPFFALQCLLAGIKMLVHKDLRKYLLIPLFINLVLYSLAFVLSYYSVSGLIQHMIPDWLSWLHWILWPLFFISFIVISFFTFTLLANLIAAPYYSQLSAKTLQIISGQRIDPVEAAWDKVFFAELKRVGYLLLRVLPLLLLFLIPVVNMIAPLLWAVFAAWGIAMEFMAYPLENKGLLFAEQKQFLQQARWGVLSFGGVTGLGLSLPIINLLIGQAAVIGATLYVYKLSTNSNTLSAEDTP
jgi:CysZ protein